MRQLRKQHLAATPSCLLACLLVLALLPGMARGQESQKVILVRNQSHSIEEFRTYAKLAARFKPFGQVQMEISALADKSWYEIPAGGSPWHEYCCYIATPWKFFPHPDIAPHLPADWVAANRRLLLAKAKIVREYGLVPFVYAKSTHFLPESFFLQHPNLRGPRVDHPRRSNREEFSWCTDLPETREYIRWMIMEMKKNIPDLATIVTGFNDSGAGLCRADRQYPGPNGPAHCRSIPTNKRVRVLCKTIHQAAQDAGGDVTIRLGNANFSDTETKGVKASLPPNTFINKKDSALVITGTQINRLYPFQGLVDPLEVLNQLAAFNDPQITTILLRFADQYYGRADDSPAAIAKFADVFQAGFQSPLQSQQQRLDMLGEISEAWGGKENREAVSDAFVAMHEGLEKIQTIAPSYYRQPLFLRVSSRFLNRPLLIKPQKLTAEEEAYFLPHVFDINEEEARDDYIDGHGGRISGTPHWRHATFLSGLNDLRHAAQLLESTQNAPEAEWFENVSLGLRMYASLLRSMDNFYHAQQIRDRHREAIQSDVPIKLTKTYSFEGDPDFIPYNDIQRDEYDNARELLDLLEQGGWAHVARARDKKHEDTFLLGPEFPSQVRTKIKLMRRHWLDVQDYLSSPLK